MITLLHNRRKYAGGQISPSVGGVWADFDLSKTGEHAAVAYLTDPAAGYYNTANLGCRGIVGLADGSLVISASMQGHAYRWGFDDGYPFQLNHLQSQYMSRFPAKSSFRSLVMDDTGTSVYYQYGNNSYVYNCSLGIPFDLSSNGAETSTYSGSLRGILQSPAYMRFSADGRYLFYKSTNSSDSSILYVLTLPEAFPKTYKRPWSLSFMALNDYISSFPGMDNTSSYYWEGFTFSPDGRCLVATRNRYVAKFVLTTPWDVSTAVPHSYIDLYNDVRNVPSNVPSYVVLTGVEVNSTGTKMIVHNYVSDSVSNSTYYPQRAFYEYDLVV